ncbi:MULTISPECIES: ribosome biogenesis GTP-binding protein YihA/YsxC [Robiginitalea]|uniref:ribosome biogenesis GTP-binding protein YihA/YsxC n=1 Tax=Robiginitalea TaxID=252306 RepID=UPI00234971D7|nr:MULTISPECIES: ribosome biogenesis GTP-binding protein YihA/YsxC [unclassified Robiginitalea]MDC6354573.1 ribosome biogenesis GTP-binding protein YihA/YsxC [Robiginitalea sp. PM2]MDC6374745.1 ribosome biogenesis GTP-binding protein YihA/YsxC [Robiginitalea sp. SP8]
MKIRSAEFVVSNTDVSRCPAEPLPEYAFIGRSNVGKSSLINMLTDRKHLAKISGRPGKTQLINHFRINDNWFLVDLPGYGYARTSKKDKAAFQKLIHRYFRERRQLLSAFLLVDIRHEPQPIDLEFMEWLTGEGIPFALIFTKADKLKPGAVSRHTDGYLQAMRNAGWEADPPFFVTSSLKGIGKDEVLAYIGEINQNFREASGGPPQ